jgi:hypothetical protein
MAKIYRRTDRIQVKIGEVTVKIAPLGQHEKAEIQQAMLSGRLKGDIKEVTRGMVLSIKHAVKAIDGVEDQDGNPYVLQFEGDALADSCVDDLLNLEINKTLSLICATLTNGVPSEFTDSDGNPLEGVEIIRSGDAAKNS